MAPLARREARWGLLFISPWIIGFLAFTLLPMVATLVFTFTNITLAQEEPLAVRRAWRTTQPLLHDRQVWDVAGGHVPVRAHLAAGRRSSLPFAVALLLNSRGTSAGTGALPGPVLPALRRAVRGGVLIWQAMLGADAAGSTSSCGSSASRTRPTGCTTPTGSTRRLVLIGIWGIGAGIIINLAGLRGIPTELYDAARIDGAGAWAQLRHVTIPMMSPVIFYTLMLGVVEVLQYFLVPLVLKNGTGEPGGSTLFYNLYLYKNFFTFQNMSYGATLAWLLFGDHAGDHARSCSGARGAGSTTRASADR